MLEDIIAAPRTDAVYNMHGYLTKVPVAAIIPLIEEFSPPGGLVVDSFAGSGMTAIAARMAGRNAIVSDISRLGKHIGEGYLCKVSSDTLEQLAKKLVTESRQKVGSLYRTIREEDGAEIEAIRTVWSFVYICSHCNSAVNYYRAFKAAKWVSTDIACQSCGEPFIKKGAKVIGEEPVFVVLKGCSGKQIEQELSALDYQKLSEAEKIDALHRIPSRVIDNHREMYKRSALEKWKLTETRKFFSQRNAAVLFDLWNRINSIADASLKKKFLFIFTSILARASKRYQWSPKAPLNAANQNYYLSPVFFEWNVYDLFLRKVEAVKRSDAMIAGSIFSIASITQTYVTASADNLSHLENESVDYVFMDPPFGSNIFYADMNLFHEAWLGGVTDDSMEAVIRTTGAKHEKERSRDRYEKLLLGAFKEAFRVLKPGSCLSIVFGNSKGSVWAMTQRAIRSAGFVVAPEQINILDKGQRSVKGLNSGRENVATLDLIVTVRKPKSSEVQESEVTNRTPEGEIEGVVADYAHIEGMTVSHIYLEVLRRAFRDGLDVTSVDIADVLETLSEAGYVADKKTGRLAVQRKARSHV